MDATAALDMGMVMAWGTGKAMGMAMGHGHGAWARAWGMGATVGALQKGVLTSWGIGKVLRQNHSAPVRFAASSHSGLMPFLKSEKDSTVRSLNFFLVRPS